MRIATDYDEWLERPYYDDEEDEREEQDPDDARDERRERMILEQEWDRR